VIFPITLKIDEYLLSSQVFIQKITRSIHLLEFRRKLGVAAGLE
jgi:hypothetical protein